MRSIPVWCKAFVVAVTVVAWTLAVLSALPVGDWWPVEISVLAGSAAVSGSVTIALLHMQRPVEDVWQSGREYGRREALSTRPLASVTSLQERRGSLG